MRTSPCSDDARTASPEERPDLLRGRVDLERERVVLHGATLPRPRLALSSDALTDGGPALLEGRVHDLVIRGGTVVDGTGAPARIADVADRRGAHRRRRRRRGPGARDARCPRAPRDARLRRRPHALRRRRRPGTPSSRRRRWHGVTTVVIGNCGVGLRARAPRPARLADRAHGRRRGHPRRGALGRASRWDWETFPEYLDALARMPRALDVGTQVPHGALRAYVDGRARRGERARDAGRHRRAWRVSCARRSRRARSASRPRGRSGIAASTAVRCRARSPARTSSAASAERSPTSVAASSRWREAGVGGRTAGDPTRRGRSRGRMDGAALGRDRSVP